MKGILTDVLTRREGDCTNYGVTHFYNSFVVTGEGMPELFEPSEHKPELKLVKWLNFYKAVPAEAPPIGTGPMFGGNFVHTSDSRFPDHPVPVHDRWEFNTYPQLQTGRRVPAFLTQKTKEGMVVEWSLWTGGTLKLRSIHLCQVLALAKGLFGKVSLPVYDLDTKAFTSEMLAEPVY